MNSLVEVSTIPYNLSKHFFHILPELKQTMSLSVVPFALASHGAVSEACNVDRSDLGGVPRRFTYAREKQLTP